MTSQEQKEFVMKVTKEIIDRKAYIKGYGNQFRVMDSEHNPIRNIDKTTMSYLKHNKIIERSGLVFISIVQTCPFVHYLDIQKPI